MNDIALMHPVKGKTKVSELDETEALMILTLIPRLGLVKINALLELFGSAVNVLLQPKEVISALPGFSSKLAEEWDRWPHEKNWKENLLLIHRENATIITKKSPDYPNSLLKIPDAPMMLYLQGSLEAKDQRAIAIVGTRQASIYGMEMAKRMAYELAAMGFTIVSGLARGIDTAAHLGALEGGRTLAVIGSGLGDIYPTENRNLARQIAERGAVISEFPMATPPDRQNFPQRNRIVSAVAPFGTVLIEAPLRSGAMITMQKSLAQGRPLFALPGRADDENFRANHHLIKRGEAFLVESAEDVASHFNDLFKSQPPKAREGDIKVDALLGEDEVKLLTVLPNQELSIEQILMLTDLPIGALNALIIKLILKGHLKEFPGKVYKKSRSS